MKVEIQGGGVGSEERLLWAFIQSSSQHLRDICSMLETKLGFGNENMINRGNLVSVCDKALELGILDLKSRFGLLGPGLEHVI